jgi:hypothetical protein
MQIEKSIFTLDALHCQKKTAEEIIASGNGYIITTKMNQPNLYNAIAAKTATKPLGAYTSTSSVQAVGIKPDMVMIRNVVSKSGKRTKK